MREELLFDQGWLFHLGELPMPAPVEKEPLYYHAKTMRAVWGPACPEYDRGGGYRTERWESVTLPHDYVIAGTPDPGENETLGYLPYENAWYRKRFTLPASDEGRRLTLLFEGVAVNCQVWLNGCLLCRNFGGYNAFEADITDTAKYGEENVLAVYVSTEDHEGWWYEGGGIYRHVRLIKTDPVCADLWGLFALPRRAGAGWRIPAELTVRNEEDADAPVTVRFSVTDAGGAELAAGTSAGVVPGRDTAVLRAELTAALPRLWSPEEPNLYTVTAELFTRECLRDRVCVRTGFREFRLDPQQGLFVNGVPTKIKGVCCHADTGLLGKAVPDNIQRYKVQLMKEMGANGFRASHYPHAQATMDALDELGFLVMDECRRFESTREGLEALALLIRRDRNRPSVLFWSVGNEEPYHLLPEGRRICRRMLALARRLDGTRAVMTAVSNDPTHAVVYDELDAIGINYNLDTYDALHARYPDKAVFSSECCATGTTRGWYFPSDPVRGYLAAYDAVPPGAWFMSRETTWKHLCARPWVLGGYQWIAFEHRGETVWPRLCSQSGAIDLFLQKKDAFWQNLSHWETRRPVCHLLPHWNFRGMEGTPIRVVCYTNQPRAELFLNGVSLGASEITPYGHGEWLVPYAPGTLTVVVCDAAGRETARDTCQTTGAPARLMLRGDNDAAANGQDVLVCTAYFVDAQGLPVPDAEAEISFSCNQLGQVVGTGSDVCDHVPVPSPVRRMRAGLCAAAVRLGASHGTLRVCASAPGMGVAVLERQV